MLDHRLRRWSNIVPTLAERLVFAGKSAGEKQETGRAMIMSVCLFVGAQVKNTGHGAHTAHIIDSQSTPAQSWDSLVNVSPTLRLDKSTRSGANTLYSHRQLQLGLRPSGCPGYSGLHNHGSYFS